MYLNQKGSGYNKCVNYCCAPASISIQILALPRSICELYFSNHRCIQIILKNYIILYYKASHLYSLVNLISQQGNYARLTIKAWKQKY